MSQVGDSAFLEAGISLLRLHGWECIHGLLEFPMNTHDHPRVPSGAANGTKGILWVGSIKAPQGSHGDPMGGVP